MTFYYCFLKLFFYLKKIEHKISIFNTFVRIILINYCKKKKRDKIISQKDLFSHPLAL